RAEISDLAERLDRHRKDALARSEKVTMTGMYNVVEKLRSGEALTKKEQEVHTLAACGVLRDLHDELDALVARAYGWPWPMAKEAILERLVALHDERVREEERGLVRWLRPEYQIPRFGKDVAAPAAPELSLVEGGGAPAAAPVSAAPPQPWPKTAIDQMAALQALFTSQALTPEEAAARFAGAPRALVRRHVETLAILGELRRTGDGKYHGTVAVAA
ncbi:MAG TPA: hypothetical protein VKA84_02110, partial [Gemmatimonadaceae bacterium]|nr:hypothetical protein [Gemmatimonadaceae bacterium]